MTTRTWNPFLGAWFEDFYVWPDVLRVVSECRKRGDNRTAIGRHVHTVFRLPGESNAEMTARITAIVNRFTAQWGRQQPVTVQALHGFTPEEGAAMRLRDPEQNFMSKVNFLARAEPDPFTRSGFRELQAGYRRGELTELLKEWTWQSLALAP